MKKYEDIKCFLDRQSNCADDYDDISSYYLICRIRQMYNELYQLKISYQKVIDNDFKDNLIKGIYSARQTLYNYNHKSYKKEDILQGMQFAIDTLTELINLESEVN